MTTTLSEINDIVSVQSRIYTNTKQTWLIEHGLTSPPTQYRLYGRRFLQDKRPNQQYQSTEGSQTVHK